ncbi:hypothetical protein AB0E63_41835 [Kribbella sp. NPDC026596]|uniref:hypothetical protein n=1 Tax=Kribbella sp. NPDC026596 TaxID=3155122 RepID=UPI0033EC5F6F
MEQVAIVAGYRVERGQMEPETGGAETDHRRRLIVVADDLEVALATMGLAHELAHLRMHKRSRDSGCYGLTRLEATSAAYVLLSRFGCLPDRPSADLLPRTTSVVGRTAHVRQIETLGGRVVSAANRLYAAAERHLPPPRIRPADPIVTDRRIVTHSFDAGVTERGLEL